MPLIESIAVQSLDLTYYYAPVEVEPIECKEEKVTKVMGSQFKFKGILVTAGLELGFNFNYKPDSTFTFKATLSSSKKSATIRDVIKGILGDKCLELPNFLNKITFSKDRKDTIIIKVNKHINTEKKDPKPDKKPKDTAVKLTETKKGSFQFVTTVQDNTNLNKGGNSRLTRKDLASLKKALPLTVKDKFKPPATNNNLLISLGSHFRVIIKDSEGKSSCILDYNFKKKASSTRKKQKGSSKALAALSFTAVSAEEKEPKKKAPKDNSNILLASYF
ncbi:hypothetical protein BKA59DRAFT_454023 [Fusarium tricinctum]|uniref:Uncharacterized protein n=1 Tax=Fusarium tricinctum TaxID=61284 RepID=A0A8K0WEQ0_9HYPO|nr:hypothetical protein BKA59DRAFT_454023 [Fusarium tricinctum]